MADLATMGRLLQKRATLVFEVASIPRRPPSAKRTRLRAEKEDQLAALDAEITVLASQFVREPVNPQSG
jgi:hypothetical protein